MKTLTRRLARAALAVLDALFPSAPEDLMVIAEATGVAADPQPAPIHVDAEYAEMVIDWHAQAHREELADPALEQMLLAWSQAAAGGDDS